MENDILLFPQTHTHTKRKCLCLFGQNVMARTMEEKVWDGEKNRGWSRRWWWRRRQALFVCSVQWSHQEASSVCEALLSQRIPSPSSEHTPSSCSSSLFSISTSEFPEMCILSITILQNLPLLQASPPYTPRLMQRSQPSLTSCWLQFDLLQVSFSVGCSCVAAKTPG